MHTFTYITVRDEDLCANCSHASKTSCCCLLLLLLPIPLAFLAILRANSWLTNLNDKFECLRAFFCCCILSYRTPIIIAHMIGLWGVIIWRKRFGKDHRRICRYDDDGARKSFPRFYLFDIEISQRDRDDFYLAPSIFIPIVMKRDGG